MHDYIALIRCNPSSEDRVKLSETLEKAMQAHDSSLVFLHGDGVDGVAGNTRFPRHAAADWQVCRTSWTRRRGGACPAFPGRLATLVALLDNISTAQRVDSFGFGGWFCCAPSSPPASQVEAQHRLGRGELLLQIDFAPVDGLQQRETLEVALGAAALELDASVLFCGAGRAHLEGHGARGWSQITDFGLLRLFVEAGGRQDAPGAGIATLDPEQAAALRASAGATLML